jgi:hypothetical protein
MELKSNSMSDPYINPLSSFTHILLPILAGSFRLTKNPESSSSGLAPSQDIISSSSSFSEFGSRLSAEWNAGMVR